MIKSVSRFFVVMITISFFSFSFVGKDTPTEGLTIGDRAPEFKICGEKQLIDLKDLRGKYVLLSFWASYDATSRMQNATLDYAAKKAGNVEMVSVSFDEYKSIFHETIKKDRITTSNCFVELDGNDSEIYKAYRLNKGFKNYLLNEKGVIIAKDIQASQLASYMN
ncbi:MAG: TlpA family protein disulfide reductase [Bacteroidaceae bacterium]|nr:TlpA family protein disulfide reductase [Bacteroidaceae bacterium]MBQ4056790.1 TlpA family protein disulfide reductase [Bacteroidaceae bacterium]